VFYLPDTNAFSDLMRGHPRVHARLALLAVADRAAICSITRGEVLHGIALMPPGRRRQEVEADAAQVFASLPCGPVPPDATDAYAGMKVAHQQLGLALDGNDLWIAATAIATCATVVTRDRDFTRMPGLPVEDWTT
jgi:tRNA(fMet)-specific endonuclease VapC